MKVSTCERNFFFLLGLTWKRAVNLQPGDIFNLERPTVQTPRRWRLPAFHMMNMELILRLTDKK